MCWVSREFGTEGIGKLVYSGVFIKYLLIITVRLFIVKIHGIIHITGREKPIEVEFFNSFRKVFR